MEEKTEKIKLQKRLKEVSLWLHGHSFYSHLIYNPEFDLLSLIHGACKFNCTGIEIDIANSCIENIPEPRSIEALFSQKILCKHFLLHSPQAPNLHPQEKKPINGKGHPDS